MKPSGLRLTAAAVSEPVTTADLKSFMRIDSTDDDGLIASLIKAATKRADEYCKRSFMEQDWRASFDSLAMIVDLPRPPLVSVDKVTLYDQDGTEYAVTDFHIDTASEPGRVFFNSTDGWPTTVRKKAAMVIDYTAGASNPTLVDQDVKHAIKLIVAFWYENRESQAMPSEAKDVLSTHRILYL